MDDSQSTDEKQEWGFSREKRIWANPVLMKSVV